MNILNIEYDDNIPDIYNQLGVEGFVKYRTYNNLIKDVISIVNPQRILEVGFFYGASSFLWLHNSSARVLSVDPMYCKFTERTANKTEQFIRLNNIASYYRHRFSFLLLDSLELLPFVENQKFDLFFIDGDHTEVGANNDFQIASQIDCPYVLIDDANFSGPYTHVYNLFVRKYSDKFEIIKYYNTPDSTNLFNVILAKKK